MQSYEANHKILVGNSCNMKQVADKSVHLIVTSPPYPMIEMWDDIMARQNPKIKTALINGAGNLAFELMHQELDKTWAEVNRVLIPGGFACINIGDATRTINGDFALYSNHSRIINAFLKLGFSNMPNIMWRKQTNAPNKFMGSGMLPAGAYVTLEHEWILIFRKGGKRAFKSEEEKLKRKESSFFWEERNVWFSDLWDLKGIKQNINTPETRARSAAYPFEIPHRLINMYSLRNDTVLDPFLGTGTTTLAAVTNQRNSIGYEIDPGLSNNIENNIMHTSVVELNSYVTGRIEQHKHFLSERSRDSKKTGPKHFNENLNLPVMTSQETEISFSFVQNIKRINNSEIISVHSIKPPHDQRTNPRKKIKSKQINRAFVQAL